MNTSQVRRSPKPFKWHLVAPMVAGELGPYKRIERTETWRLSVTPSANVLQTIIQLR